MAKRILVIGGSYFIGRVFTLLADRTGEYDITVLNRGRFPFKKESIRQVNCDRRDEGALSMAPYAESYDAVVDFCADVPGDNRLLLSAMENIPVGQYVHISSCAVMQPSQAARGENAPLVDRNPTNVAEEYVYSKMLLEKEVREECGKRDIPCTILRPTFVYGPFNYAPRESYYFDLIFKGEPVPFPVDATAQFQVVYVKDIAQAIMKSIGNNDSHGETFNIVAPAVITYDRWKDFLLSIAPQMQVREVTVQEVLGQDIPLPFPLDQNELFDGGKAERILKLSYTPFEQGMKETYESFLNVYGGK